MKKICLFATVLIAAVAGTICYNYESDNELSDLAKKNVKALASDEKDKDCIDSPRSICVIAIVTPDGGDGKPFPDQRNPMEIVD